MASGFYEHGLEEIMRGHIELDADDIRAILIDDTDYSHDYATDQNLDDIAAAARVATASLVNESVGSAAAAAFDADDLTFSSVTGDAADTLVFYYHTGVESTSTLICRIESGDVTGLPVTPNGADITAVWAAAGIFSFG